MDVVALSPLEVLLVGEDARRSATLAALLAGVELPSFRGVRMRKAASLDEAAAALREDEADLVLADLALGRVEDRAALRALVSLSGDLPVVVVDRDGQEEDDLDAVALGAQEVLSAAGLDARGLSRAIRLALTRSGAGQAQTAGVESAPGPRFARADLSHPVQDRSALLQRAEAANVVELLGIASASPTMQELFATVERFAPTLATILIQGESGTGKELLARAAHERSGRRGAFVTLDCAALPAALQAELFGVERGPGDRPLDPFRQARGGTLLLDEVGTLSPAAQLGLLRLLQGEPLEVRILAATSVSLRDAVRQGSFRQDLLYRLDVLGLELPPLRDRPEDVVHLFRRFARELALRYELEPPLPGRGFLLAMLGHPWPGNVRQLENLVERLVLTRAPCSDEADFHALVRPHHPLPPRRPTPPSGPAAPLDLSLTLVEFLDRQERLYMEALLGETGGAVQAAAARAAVNRRTILRKLRKHGLSRAEFL